MYYIDFDNTLYETGRLTKDVLWALAEAVVNEKPSLARDKIFKDIRDSFNSTVDNFFDLAQKVHVKYDVSYAPLHAVIMKALLLNGKNYVFPDALEFLKRLKDQSEKSCILTYVAQPKNLTQQALKLAGSGVLDLVTEYHSTTRYKFEIGIDYKKGIFIDDSPRDLEGFYASGARNLIRIIKPNNEKRTTKELNLPVTIPTYTSFDDVPIIGKSKD